MLFLVGQSLFQMSALLQFQDIFSPTSFTLFSVQRRGLEKWWRESIFRSRSIFFLELLSKFSILLILGGSYHGTAKRSHLTVLLGRPNHFATFGIEISKDRVWKRKNCSPFNYWPRLLEKEQFSRLVPSLDLLSSELEMVIQWQMRNQRQHDLRNMTSLCGPFLSLSRQKANVG